MAVHIETKYVLKATDGINPSAFTESDDNSDSADKQLRNNRQKRLNSKKMAKKSKKR